WYTPPPLAISTTTTHHHLPPSSFPLSPTNIMAILGGGCSEWWWSPSRPPHILRMVLVDFVDVGGRGDDKKKMVMDVGILWCLEKKILIGHDDSEKKNMK
ncbi:hypothetical protein Tco_0250858, partial [Tanacetum coccineum]